MADQAPILRATGIHMAFDGVDVLKGVSIELHAGEVLGLIGENGAGKSTLAKIIAGVYRAREGRIEIDGTEVHVQSPHVASTLGIALIHQEPLTFPDLDIAENIFIGHQPTQAGRVDWVTTYRRAGEILASLGVKLDPRTKVRGLSIADQQMVEMAAALSQDARILLMDEPTAALTPSEVADLFTIIRRLRDQGTAVVFVSHRLEEVFDICDRITVLRDGEFVGERDAKTTSVDEIIRMMVGRPLSALFERPAVLQRGEAPLLEVQHLSRAMKFEDISFNVRAGEIVGMAGLVGSGRTEVARALFGTLVPDSGEIRINGAVVKIRNPQDAMARGLIYLPEDRQNHGLLMPMSISQNMTLPVLKRLAPHGWLHAAVERQVALQYAEKLRIVLRSVNQPVRELSGGNQQKVVISKWLLVEPKIMVLDEPTRGIDIGAKAEVHRLMGELASQGMAILMISSELPEVLAMSDRVLVMREGRLVAQFDREQANSERIMAAATGQQAAAELPVKE